MTSVLFPVSRNAASSNLEGAGLLDVCSSCTGLCYFVRLFVFSFHHHLHSEVRFVCSCFPALS